MCIPLLIIEHTSSELYGHCDFFFNYLENHKTYGHILNLTITGQMGERCPIKYTPYMPERKILSHSGHFNWTLIQQQQQKPGI
jgi:hypothetical protein